MPHDGLAGVDLGYNMLNLTERITSGDTTLAEYAYLSDGTRLCAQRGDGSGVQYRGSLIYSKSTDGTLTLDCALTTGGAIVKQDGGESASGRTYQERRLYTNPISLFLIQQLRNNKLTKVNEKALTNKRLLSIDTADPVLRHLPRPRSPIL